MELSLMQWVEFEAASGSAVTCQLGGPEARPFALKARMQAAVQAAMPVVKQAVAETAQVVALAALSASTKEQHQQTCLRRQPGLDASLNQLALSEPVQARSAVALAYSEMYLTVRFLANSRSLGWAQRVRTMSRNWQHSGLPHSIRKN